MQQECEAISAVVAGFSLFHLLFLSSEVTRMIGDTLIHFYHNLCCVSKSLKNSALTPCGLGFCLVGGFCEKLLSYFFDVLRCFSHYGLMWQVTSVKA